MNSNDNNSELPFISFFSENREYLLKDLLDVLGSLDHGFSPVIIKELNRRLNFVIKNFDRELKKLLNESFDVWKTTNTHIRELTKLSLEINKTNKNRKSITSDVPVFIKDVEFGPLRNNPDSDKY
tara:strand:+ start:400 stop:774 length:375 start_codon:yes stop_codon:yes gene_type:complete